MDTNGVGGAHPRARCPSCSAPVDHAVPRCASCGVALGSPTGRRLLIVEERIADLSAERSALLTRLRREAVATGTTGTAQDPPRTATRRTGTRPAPGGGAGPALGAVRARIAALGPQTLLAAAGVVLLAVAAIVFTAVSWRDLPMLVRGGILLGAAAAAGRLTATLMHRDLNRTAEATGVLTVVLLAVLCNGLWRAGLIDPLADLQVLALASAVLATVSHVLARVTRVRSPLVLAAWLAGTAVHVGGVWLTDPYAASGVSDLGVLVLLATDLLAALVAGSYAVRFLVVVPRWRVATLAGAGGLLWATTAVAAPVVVAALSPATPADLLPFAVGVAVVIAAAALAGLACRITGPLARAWPAVGIGGMWFAATLGSAGALWQRLPAWPDMAIVVTLAAGAAVGVRLTPGWRRLGAVVGMTPVLMAALTPVVTAAEWALGAAVRLATGVAVVDGPEAAGLASVVAVCAITGRLAMAVERARPVLLAVAGASWGAAVAGASVGLAVLSPSQQGEVWVFVGLMALLGAAGAMAVAAGRAAMLARSLVAGGVAFATTAGIAGALWDRVAGWPELPVVAGLVVGTVLVWWRTHTAERAGALVGILPVAVAGLVPVAVTVGWLVDLLVRRVLSPWPTTPVAVLPPDGSTVVSAVVVSVITVALAVAVGRAQGAATVAGGMVAAAMIAAGCAVWPAAGGAVVGLVAIAGAVAGVRRAPHPLALAILVAATAVTVAASLTVPAVTIATLASAAAVGAAALPVRAPAVAVTVAGLCTADLIGLSVAIAAATTDGTGPSGLTVLATAAAAWLVAAAVRVHRDHAAGIEATAAVAVVPGLVLSARHGPLWLGVALAILAVGSAAVAVWRSDRRWLQWVSSASASASSWSILADRGVDVIEAYTAPPALLLIGLAVLRLRSRPRDSSWPILGPGLTLLTAPTVVQVVGDPGDLTRLAAALLLGSALTVAGRARGLQSPLVIGVVTCVVAALTQHHVVTGILPRWVLLAIGGGLLLWLSISYEEQRRRLVGARRRLDAMR